MCESGQDYPRGLLLLGHGSDEPAFREEIERLSGQVKEMVSLPFVDVAYLERLDPTIATGVERGLAAGVGEIICTPVFLFAGQDIKGKLPDALSPSRAKYPNLSLLLTRPFGPDGRLVEILQERMREAGLKRPGSGERVILVGRGSSDPEPAEGLAELAEMLQERSGFPVNIAFLDGADPDLPIVIGREVAEGATSILVLPCLLFRGVILNRVAREVESLREKHPSVQIVLGGHLGPHPNLARIIAERVRDAV
ncbi:MAG TPA: sirohydrochlorin chelatase [Nitrospiria bacterium]|nr:sirohydrochlorin chelatase [Nitrospiria bacterium]